jgi:hypothetical protein
MVSNLNGKHRIEVIMTPFNVLSQHCSETIDFLHISVIPYLKRYGKGKVVSVLN